MPVPARTWSDSFSRGVSSWRTHQTDCDGVLNTTLTTINSPSRSPTLALPRTPAERASPATVAIFQYKNAKAYSSSHDVPITVNTSSPSSPVNPQASQNVVSSTPSSSKHVPLNYSSPCLSQVPDLAVQHGIPMVLPKAPSTAPRRSTHTSTPAVVNFSTIRHNYVKMLSTNSSTSPTTSTSAPLDSMKHINHTPEQRAAVEFFESVIGDTSPLFSDADDFLTGEQTPSLGFFDTSPYETPYHEFLSTPLFQDMGEPLITDDFEDMNLFGAMEPVVDKTQQQPSDAASLLSLSPAFDASSVYYSPKAPSGSSFFTSTSSLRKPTGTRKNITPASMVSLDAPTQPRQYRTPSATSRKELPATFARKRTRNQAFADDDELELEDLGPNATEAEQIEHKRRQNTIAARKSRKRKLEYQQELETKVDSLRIELEQWRVRAEIYEGVLRSHGLAAAALPPL